MSAVSRPGESSAPLSGHPPSPDPRSDEHLTRRSVLAAPLVAVVTLICALVATHEAGVSFRDPDNVALKYVVLVGFAVLVLVSLDVIVRAGHRTGTRRPSREAMRAVRRERWGWYRGVAAGGALLSFYVSYLSYGNIKTVLPLVRPGDLFDDELRDADRALFFGHDPAELLHTILGTGLQTHVLSVAYVAFIVFLPLSLALALVFAKNLRGGLFVATALSLNWPLGAATYVLIPALGPIYATPGEFAALPTSAVTELQNILLVNRTEFLANPDAPGTGQAIAAFASLHVSMTVTAAVAATLLGLGRRLRIALWVVVGVTLVNTVYLGWHYFVDDIGGIAIAAVALALARVLTGVRLAAARRSTAEAPVPSPASA